MHDGNYDPNDPRCMKYKHLINSLENYRKNFEIDKDSKFVSKRNYLESALDEIYRFFKMEIGYAPAWLFNAIEEEMGRKGRSRTYTLDDRIFNSSFVHMLVSKGASQVQSINLLGLLKGKKVVEEGFFKEVRESYKEFLHSDFFEELADIPDRAKFLSTCTHLGLKNINSNDYKVDEALIKLREICNEIITYVRQNYHLLENHDPKHPEMFAAFWEPLQKDEGEILSYFFESEFSHTTQSWKRGYSLRQIIYAIEFFEEKNYYES